MDEITFLVRRDEDSGWLVASWDDPAGTGGITTQSQDLRDLQDQIMDAVSVHFDEGKAPRRIRMHSCVSELARSLTVAARKI
jgi:hypothetical protein